MIQRSPKSLFPQALVHQNPVFFQLLAYLAQSCTYPTFDSFLYLFSGFLSMSGILSWIFPTPIITLEVSETSRHLGWCWVVGSGTQACTQVLLAAAAGFSSSQLRGRVWLLLGAKLRPLSPQHLSGVQGYKEMGSLKQLMWGSSA